MIGAFVATIGFVLCIFSTTVEVMMVTYGVIGGWLVFYLIHRDAINLAVYKQYMRNSL